VRIFQVTDLNGKTHTRRGREYSYGVAVVTADKAMFVATGLGAPKDEDATHPYAQHVLRKMRAKGIPAGIRITTEVTL